MENIDEKRLWIGNLDPRINEYTLLKLMQKYGTIEKFDLLFYRSGPLVGQPRGYAFVSFEKNEDAVRAKEYLHNKLVGEKKIVVKWAHSITEEDTEKPRPHLNIPVLTGTQKNTKRPSKETQIQAIEAKLKIMEKHGYPEFDMDQQSSTSSTQNPIRNANNKDCKKTHRAIHQWHQKGSSYSSKRFTKK